MAYRTKTQIEILKNCDELIRPAVKIIMQFGFKTTESCQGTPGHAMPEPTIYFEGTEFDIVRAIEVCLAHNLNVLEGRRIYRKGQEVLANNDYRNWQKPLGYTYWQLSNAIVFKMYNNSIFCPSD